MISLLLTEGKPRTLINWEYPSLEYWEQPGWRSAIHTIFRPEQT